MTTRSSSSSDVPPSRRSWPRRLLNRLEVGQAVFFAVSLRVWQLFGGAITMLMMTRFFTLETQGFYYVFSTLIGLQAFFELGFNIVIVNICSHEWSVLRLGEDNRIEGDEQARSRLISFGRLLFRWYGVASFLFVLIVSGVGTVVIALRATPGISWQAPWLSLVVVSGLLLWSLPFNAMLEGCNQVIAVNRFRLLQAVTASVAVWWVMWQGGGLWAAVAAASARLICEWGLLLVWFRRFFAPFFRQPPGATINWREEVWPLQWRLAVGAALGYFASLFALVMWLFHGPVLAGQMGMTWTVVTAIQAAALAWVQTRAPLFGILVSQGERSELDRVFFRVTSLAILAFIVAAVAFVSVVLALGVSWPSVAIRVLSPLPTILFLIGALAQLVVVSLSFYVRAHKQEPFLVAGILSNLAIGINVCYLGWMYGAVGAGAGFVLATTCVTLPTHFVLWRRCRRAFATG